VIFSDWPRCNGNRCLKMEGTVVRGLNSIHDFCYGFYMYSEKLKEKEKEKEISER
jgi:hypothetical protein